MTNRITEKQKKIARLITKNATLDKPLNGGEMLGKVGYSASMTTSKVNDVLESAGVQQELKNLGFTEENAKTVVTEILLNPKVKPDTRIRAAQEVFKVEGSYAPEKSQALNLNVGLHNLPNSDLEKIRQEYEDKLKAKLLK